jgi:serine/threonine protein kinase
MHCDLKPENILIKSYSRSEVKVIDFGSSCFITDQLSSYVQSRSYRAPEVVLGHSYDARIDIWSLGCILAELWTGRVLFQNESLATLLAKHIGIVGLRNTDREYLKKAPFRDEYFTQTGVLFEKKAASVEYIYPKRTCLRKRLQTDDFLFVDFICSLLRINPKDRPTAVQALHHPWFSVNYD